MGKRLKSLRVFIDTRDWWVGYYRSYDYHYVILIPTVVIRWDKKNKVSFD